MLRHNVHNDMNVIRGYGQMVRDENRGRPAAHAALIVDQGEHLLSTVDKERVITNTLSEQPRPRSVDISTLFPERFARIRESYPEADVTLDLPSQSIASAIPNIDQSVSELVENAISHTEPEPPEVGIKVDSGDDQVEIRISDNGPEIARWYVDVLAATSEEPLYHGSGLGLWLVH